MVNLIKLWEFSGQIQTELVLGSRIKATGDNKEAVLDRYKDDLSKLKSNSRLNSLFISSILILPAIVAIQSVNQSQELIITSNIDQILFANSVAVASYYVFNFVFMLLFGLMTIASLLDGKIFKFLHTLPFSKQEIQILGIMSFIRLLLYQIVIMLLVFPIGMLIITQSWTVFSISFILNLINLILGCYFLIILINKMTGILFNQNQKFGFKSILRYFFFVIYIMSAFSIYYLVGSIGTIIDRLYATNILPNTTIQQINQVLPFFAFPFTTGYILSILTLDQFSSSQLLINSIIGLVILILITMRVVKSGNKILLNMAYKTNDFNEINDEVAEVKIATKKPLHSYIRMNLLIVGRDLSSLISITMAILFPILPLLQGNNQDLFVSFIFYSGFIIFFSANALSVTEGSVGGLLSSLPISNRLMLRGKHILIGIIYILAYLILSLVSRFTIVSIKEILIILILAILLPNVFLIAKSRLFGEINGEYTLFDIEDSNNIVRNFVLIIPVMIVVFLEFFIFYNISNFSIFFVFNEIFIIGIINLLLLILIEILNRRMYSN